MLILQLTWAVYISFYGRLYERNTYNLNSCIINHITCTVKIIIKHGICAISVFPLALKYAEVICGSISAHINFHLQYDRYLVSVCIGKFNITYKFFKNVFRNWHKIKVCNN